MIRINCVQGSPEWIQARLGIPTASQFHRIISPKKLKPSESAEKYMYELLAEQMLQEPIDTNSSEFMVRGSTLEAGAIEYYELQRDVDTEKVGFILTDDRLVGCSPDRLVGDDGGLEIKCPSAAVHVGYLVDGFDDNHRIQVQGCMYVTGRDWWDLESYNPLLPAVVARAERDELVTEALSEGLKAFFAKMRDARWKLEKAGHLEPSELWELKVA